MSAAVVAEAAVWAVLLLACLPAWAVLQGRERRHRARGLLGGPGGAQQPVHGPQGGLWARARATVERVGPERPGERLAGAPGIRRPKDGTGTAAGPSGAGEAARADGPAFPGGRLGGRESPGPVRPRADGAAGNSGGSRSGRGQGKPGKGRAAGFGAEALRVAGRRIGVEWVCVPLGALLGAVTWSVVPLGAGAAAVPLVRGALRRRADRAAAERTSAAVSALCGTVAADLRAGRPPHVALADAVETAGWSGAPERVDVARLLLSAARFGGDVPRALREAARCGPGAHGLAAVAACWQVAVDGGAGLAAALDRVAEALRAEADQRDDLRAQLAGPRSTAVLLALLPAFGLVLGTGLGADPSKVLLHTPAGLVCLAAGALLEWGGLAWTARIVSSAEGGPPGAGLPRASARRAALDGRRS